MSAVFLKVLAKCDWVGRCLIWRGYVNEKGYGTVWDGSRTVKVHRVIYEHLRGAIPAGYVIDHVQAKGCQSRACCNIDHLEAVTNLENTLRGSNFIAVNASKTHCSRGHILAGDNLDPGEWRRKGVRGCLECARRRARESKLRRRQCMEMV